MYYKTDHRVADHPNMNKIVLGRKKGENESSFKEWECVVVEVITFYLILFFCSISLKLIYSWKWFDICNRSFKSCHGKGAPGWLLQSVSMHLG